jgi:hypothetical protein
MANLEQTIADLTVKNFTDLNWTEVSEDRKNARKAHSHRVLKTLEQLMEIGVDSESEVEFKIVGSKAEKTTTLEVTIGGWIKYGFNEIKADKEWFAYINNELFNNRSKKELDKEFFDQFIVEVEDDEIEND